MSQQPSDKPVAPAIAAAPAPMPAAPIAAGASQQGPNHPIGHVIRYFAQHKHAEAIATAHAAGQPAPSMMGPAEAQAAFLALPVQTQREFQHNFTRMALGERGPINTSLPGTAAPAVKPATASKPASSSPTTPSTPTVTVTPATAGAPTTGSSAPTASAASTAGVKKAASITSASRPPTKNPPKRARIEIPTPIVPRTTQVTRDNSPDDHTEATPRRRDDGLRGTMRSEIARLMYAAGDVVEPDVDSVDYVEDLVFEFLADLCRPVQPIRTTPASARAAVPLSGDVLRHRLATHSYLRKYLERWDDMSYMWAELQSSRRVTAPTHQDLIQSVGKQFLGLDAEQEQQVGVKRRLNAADGDGDPSKKRGRPPKPPEERKKPGPKKGWKKNLDPNALPKKKAPVKKKLNRAQSASVAPNSPVKTPKTPA